MKRLKQNRGITVCSSLMKYFENGPLSIPAAGDCRIDHALLHLFKGNFIADQTAIIDRSFLLKNGIQYRGAWGEESYRLWFDIAKQGGAFFLEPQCLQFLIAPDSSTLISREELLSRQISVQEEILDFLLQNSASSALLTRLYCELRKVADCRLLEKQKIFQLYSDIFQNEINVTL